jgi:hypothetical protein
MNRHPFRGDDNSLIAHGRRYQQTRLVAYTPPLPSKDPTDDAVRELAALENYLKQNGWVAVGRGSFWYSFRFKQAVK